MFTASSKRIGRVVTLRTVDSRRAEPRWFRQDCACRLYGLANLIPLSSSDSGSTVDPAPWNLTTPYLQRDGLLAPNRAPVWLVSVAVSAVKPETPPRRRPT